MSRRHQPHMDRQLSATGLSSEYLKVPTKVPTKVHTYCLVSMIRPAYISGRLPRNTKNKVPRLQLGAYYEATALYRSLRVSHSIPVVGNKYSVIQVREVVAHCRQGINYR